MILVEELQEVLFINEVSDMYMYTTAKKKRPNQLGYLVGIWL